MSTQHSTDGPGRPRSGPAVVAAKIAAYPTPAVMTLLWLISPTAYGDDATLDLESAREQVFPTQLLFVAAAILVLGAVALVGVLMLARPRVRLLGACLFGAVWVIGVVTTFGYDPAAADDPSIGHTLLQFLHLGSIVPAAGLFLLARPVRTAHTAGAVSATATPAMNGPLSRMGAEASSLHRSNAPAQYQGPARPATPPDPAGPVNPPTTAARDEGQPAASPRAQPTTPLAPARPMTKDERRRAKFEADMAKRRQQRQDVLEAKEWFRPYKYALGWTGLLIVGFWFVSLFAEDQSSIGSITSLLWATLVGVAAATLAHYLPRWVPQLNRAEGSTAPAWLLDHLPLAGFITGTLLGWVTIYAATGGSATSLLLRLFVIGPVSLVVIGGVLFVLRAIAREAMSVPSAAEEAAMRVAYDYGDYGYNAGGQRTGADCKELIIAVRKAPKDSPSYDELRMRLFSRAKGRHCGTCVQWRDSQQR